nr:serine hydrolase domain-containing protein [Halomonas socia]
MISTSRFLLAMGLGAWLSLVVAVPAVANDDAAHIDALFAEFDRDDSPGAAVAVYREGELAFSAGYGLADLEAGTPLTPRTPTHVASVSKQFTAFAIALLAREGKLDLDADIRDYLPWVPDFGTPIRVRHLIHHTSGLRDQWILFQLSGQEMGNRLRQQHIVNMVSRQRSLNFPPGSEHAYSNTGYTLLAEIVRAASGQSLREFTTQRIFEPLGMERTFFFDDVTEVVPGRANSYSRREDGDAWRRELLNFDNVGTTSLFTTVEDLAAWAGNFSRPVVSDRELIEQVTMPGTLDDGSPLVYAFGLQTGAMAGHRTIQHSGRDAGFRSLFVYFPEHDIAVAAAANTPISLNEKVEAIAEIYLPEAESDDIVEASLAAEVESGERLAELEGVYLSRHATLRLEVEDGELGYTSRRGDMEWRVELVLREDDSLDDGGRESRYFEVLRDAHGTVTALAQYDNRGERQASFERQAALPEPSPKTLQAYAGDYRSPELDITYRVRLEGDGLVIDSIWSLAPAELRPVAEDRFETDHRGLGTLVFQRNGDGEPLGYRVHTERVRDVWFERLVPGADG